MYILIVARGYPTTKYKGNGIFEFDQAKALVQAGHKVIFAAVDVRSIRRWRKWGFESLKKEGVQIEAINIPVGRIHKSILRKMQFAGFKQLYDRIERKYGKPDIIHSHFISKGYIIARLLKNSDIPLIHTEHYSRMNIEELSEDHQNMGKNTYIYMDKVISVSKFMADNLKKKFNVAPIVIPNIVDTSNFQYKPFKKPNDTYKFISVGGLLANKRMDLLINSFNDAFKNEEKVKLYIYGDGPERNRLKNLINTHKLNGRVYLMGLSSREIIAKKMSVCDCFVLASELETFGVAYIEALAMGVPVIATKCGGTKDFVHKNNGIMIEVDDLNALTEAMLKMYYQGEKFDRQKISDEAIAKYAPEVVVEQLTDIYLHLFFNR